MHIPQALSLDQNNVTLCLTLFFDSLFWVEYFSGVSTRAPFGDGRLSSACVHHVRFGDPGTDIKKLGER